jgi:hypothetical protein
MMMVRITLFGLIVALVIFNAIYSPFSFLVFVLQGIWYPSFLPAPMGLLLALSSIIAGLLIFLLAGIPAAFFEKMFPRFPLGSTMIWLAATALPTAQTLKHLRWI